MRRRVFPRAGLLRIERRCERDKQDEAREIERAYRLYLRSAPHGSSPLHHSVKRPQRRIKRLINPCPRGIRPPPLPLRFHRRHSPESRRGRLRARWRYSPVPTIASSAAPYAEPSCVSSVTTRLSKISASICRQNGLFAPPPEARTESTAHAQLLDDIEAIVLAVGNAFDQRANQIGARVLGGQADPASARRRVQMRRALAHQIGQPEQALRTRRRGRGFRRERVVTRRRAPAGCGTTAGSTPRPASRPSRATCRAPRGRTCARGPAGS